MIREIVTGPNLSGKSELLRGVAGLGDASKTSSSFPSAAYISPDPTSNFSGLAPTGRSEIELLARSGADAEEAFRKMESFGMAHCLDQNPFTCSGGEQVVLAIVAALSSKVKTIAIDSAFEQLNKDTRDRLFTELQCCTSEVTIADNRARDWNDGRKLRDLGGAGTTAFMVATTARSEDPVDLDVRDLSFRYKNGAQVFQNYNVRFEKGKFYRLIGPNGAGKSTLARLIAGLLRPARGEICVNNKPVRPWKSPGKAVSYHFQNPDYQMFATTISEQLGPDCDVSDSLGALREKPDDHPLDLPFAMRKRLAVLNALNRPAPFLVLDEPTLGQDDAYVEWLSGQIDGRSGFVVTHSEHFKRLPTIELGS